MKNLDFISVSRIVFNLPMYLGCGTEKRRRQRLLLAEFSRGQNAFLLTITCGNPATKSRNASITWSLLLVVLKSLLDFPSLFLIPSIRKPNVAVDEIVSLQTMYLFAKKKKKNGINNRQRISFRGRGARQKS